MSHGLTRASRELFARGEDEVFHSLQDLFDHCRREREQSMDRWEMPRRLQPLACPDGLLLNLGLDGAFQMNDWSFGQLCRLAKVHRETVNRVSADTATRSSFPCPILKFTQRVFLKPQITQIPQIQHSKNDPLYLRYL